MFRDLSEPDVRPDTDTYWPFWYVRHGKGPRDGLGLDNYRNGTEFMTPPPLVPLPQTCLCRVSELPCVQARLLADVTRLTAILDVPEVD